MLNHYIYGNPHKISFSAKKGSLTGFISIIVRYLFIQFTLQSAKSGETGLPTKDETEKTTWNASNITILWWNKIFCLRDSLSMTYLMISQRKFTAAGKDEYNDSKNPVHSFFVGNLFDKISLSFFKAKSARRLYCNKVHHICIGIFPDRF